MRVSITCQNGTEVDQVVHLDRSETDRIAQLEKEILRLVGQEQRIGVIAATRVIWSQLKCTNVT